MYNDAEYRLTVSWSGQVSTVFAGNSIADCETFRGRDCTGTFCSLTVGAERL
jgi:hypothetical protein